MQAEGKVNDTDARLWHFWLRINRVLRRDAAHALERGGVAAGPRRVRHSRSGVRSGAPGCSTDVGVSGLALICAERSRETRRFQASSAPRVLLSP